MKKISTTRVKKICFNTVLVLASFSICVLLVEFGLYLADFRPSWKFATGFAVDNSVYRYAFRPGIYDDLFRARNVRINSLGTRGPEPRSPTILTLGDSCTFGVGVLEEETFPFLLSKNTQEVMNAGVVGYNSFQGLSWFKLSLMKQVRPKLVTVYFGWNDHWRALLTEKYFSYIRRAAAYSRIASLMLRYQETLWSQDPKIKHLRIMPQVWVSEFRENLKEIINLSKEIGATVVLITAAQRDFELHKSSWFQSHDLSEYQDHGLYVEAVREVAKDMGVGLVDFHSEMERLKGENPHEYFLDFAHLTPKGHQVLADLLKPWVDCAMRDTCKVSKI